MSNISNFKEAKAVLNRYIPNASGQRGAYTLERIRLLTERLGNPQNKYKVVHVAGTSGKTSTSYYMASLLKAAGYKAGLTVSPHIDEINERVQIDLVPLPEDVFCKQLSEFIDLVEATGIKPTYFELLVAFAYWQFAESGVDYAVVEVGLGGLLDGTNVITSPNKVCIITDIGLDHTEVLGKTLPEIAAQKAGIIRPHNKVFMYQQSEEVMSVAREVCEQQQADLHELLKNDSPIELKKLPLFQQRNWYLAYSAFQYICARDDISPLSQKQLAASTEVYVPARMEIISYKHKTVILDGAHNAQKLATLFGSIESKYKGEDMAVMLSLKQTRGIRAKTSLQVITQRASWLGLTSFSGSQDTPYKSVDPTKIAEYCHVMNFDNWEVIKDPQKAFNRLLQRPEKILVVTGSFYLLNHIRPAIGSIIKK